MAAGIADQVAAEGLVTAAGSSSSQGAGVIFSVKFRFDDPPQGSRAMEVKVQFDGVTQELQVGEAIVRKAYQKIWIDPASGNAVIDVAMIPLPKGD